MVDEQLTVVQTRKNFHMRRRAELEQVLHLRLGDKGFFRAVPEMNVCAVDGLQAIGINGLVAIQYGLLATERIDLLALIE